MPWEKSFNIDEAVDRATEIFWEKGYDSTSLSNLIQAMGVQKGSFYNAFGNKKKLFALSLIKYHREQGIEKLTQLTALNDPLTAIEMFFDTLIKESVEDKKKKGCFLINVALDMQNHDEDIQLIVKKGLCDIENFLKNQLIVGIKIGTIPHTVDPERDSKGLLTLLVGLRVLSRGIFDKASLDTIKTQAMRMLS